MFPIYGVVRSRKTYIGKQIMKPFIFQNMLTVSGYKWVTCK